MIIKYDSPNRTSLLSNTVSSLYGGPREKTLKALIDSYYVGYDSSPMQSRKVTRTSINQALERRDLKALRQLSRYFYTSNLMYMRFVKYLANILCYYWIVTPRVKNPSIKEDELLETWWDVLDYIEIINPEIIGPYIAEKVLLDGACYVAVKEKTTKSSAFGLQYLPLEYCRTRKRYLDRDVVDFNLTYFDDKFTNAQKRKAALESFPPCIAEKYYEFKLSKSKDSDASWVTIDPDYAFRFSLRVDEVPFFIGTVLDLLDIQDVKDITMYKLEQELSKILVQKFGTDSDGHPIVDLEELKTFHRDTAAMLQNVPGADVITTYADVTSVDLQSRENSSGGSNPTSNITNNVYDTAGISQMLFNANNSGTLSKAITVNETLMFPLLKQIREFLEVRIKVNFSKGKTGKAIDFKVMMPELTYSNRNDYAKLYKEQASLGYSKFLPAIALGQRQSDIMASLIFENDILHLVDKMQPPQSSNTMSSSGSGDGRGRPTKSDDEVSEKTIKNKETL